MSGYRGLSAPDICRQNGHHWTRWTVVFPAKMPWDRLPPPSYEQRRCTYCGASQRR